MKRWKVDPKEKYNGKTIRQWWIILNHREAAKLPVGKDPPPTLVPKGPPPLPVIYERVEETESNQEKWLCFYCDRPFGQHPDNTKCPDSRLKKWLNRAGE